MGENVPVEAPAEAPAEPDAAPVPADSSGNDLHEPLDRLSGEAADEDPYAVGEREIEGIRLGRFSGGILDRANAVFGTILATAYALFQQYLLPVLQPLWKTITLQGGVWNTAQRAWQGARSFLQTNQQQLLSAMRTMASVGMFLVKFTVGAVIILAGMARDGIAYFRDAAKPGQQPAEGAPSSGSRAAAQAEGWLGSLASAAKGGMNMASRGAESLLNGQLLANFRDFIQDKEEDKEQPSAPAAEAGPGPGQRASHVKSKTRRNAAAAVAAE